MTEVLQKSIYKNHVAMYECQVLNYFHWHTGIFKVDVKFEELRGHKDFNNCLIIQPEQYDEYLNLDIDKHRNARAIFQVHMTDIWKITITNYVHLICLNRFEFPKHMHMNYLIRCGMVLKKL